MQGAYGIVPGIASEIDNRINISNGKIRSLTLQNFIAK